MRLTPG